VGCGFVGDFPGAVYPQQIVEIDPPGRGIRGLRTLVRGADFQDDHSRSMGREE
jgi:hypothetical protein